jgi:hypothetical protein
MKKIREKGYMNFNLEEVLSYMAELGFHSITNVTKYGMFGCVFFEYDNGPMPDIDIDGTFGDNLYEVVMEAKIKALQKRRLNES